MEKRNRKSKNGDAIDDEAFVGVEESASAALNQGGLPSSSTFLPLHKKERTKQFQSCFSAIFFSARPWTASDNQSPPGNQLGTEREKGENPTCHSISVEEMRIYFLKWLTSCSPPLPTNIFNDCLHCI